MATRVLVVAGGAVQTPRLLLMSAGAAAKDGLANDSGEVGRNLMETLAWSSAGLHPDGLGSHRGLPAELVCWTHNAPDAIPGVPGGIRLTARTGEAGFSGPVNYAQRVIGGWGAGHKQRMRESFGRMLAVGMVGESLPNARPSSISTPRSATPRPRASRASTPICLTPNCRGWPSAPAAAGRCSQPPASPS